MSYKRFLVLTALVGTLAIGLIYGSRKASASPTTRVVDDNLACPGATYTSIQAAVNDSSPGDIVKVCAGTYNELVTIDRTLTIQGAQAGADARVRAVPVTSESVVGTGDGAFQIEADNVAIDGFTIQGVVNDPSQPPFTSLGAGIWTNPGFSNSHGGHQILNNIIQGNIIGIELDNDGTFQTKVQQNLIQNNNASGPDSGAGIDTNFGLANAVIDSNKFVGHNFSGISSGGPSLTISNNEFDGNRRAMGLFGATSSSITGNNIHNSTDLAPSTGDIRLFGGSVDLSITCNDLSNGAGRGIYLDDSCGGCPNSTTTINNNNISGYAVAGLQLDSGGYFGGSLNAENNWWGSATGPTIASNPGGTGDKIIDPDNAVDFSPFSTSPATCAPDLCPADPNKVLPGACGCGHPESPGCKTTKKDCHDFVEQQEKNFNDGQKDAKKAFDDCQKTEKKNFDATHPTPAQRKAFEEGQKNDKKTFDDGQKADRDAFQVHYKAEEQQCNQLPK